MTTQTTVVVIGAGPAGLAVSACLGIAGVDYVVLERAEKLAPKWRMHYERLHLHTYRDLSNLPFKKWNRGVPAYPSRRQVVDYMEEYAAEFRIRPLFGQNVQKTERIDGRWKVETQDRVFEARDVVIATGYNQEPVLPTWPAQASFRGDVIHSQDYQNGAAWRGKHALVVGAGNSGAEIAICLYEHGATTNLCIRGPIHVVPRDVLGRLPAQVVGQLLSRLPSRLADRLGVITSKLEFGDLTEYGITRPKLGPISQIRELGRVPLIDVGTIDLIRRGEIRVVPGIERFHENGVTFVDGRKIDVDLVVLATGYRAAIDAFLEGPNRYLNERGYPKKLGAEAEPPEPYFVGFGNPPTGQLLEIREQARAVADKIAGTEGRTQ